MFYPRGGERKNHDYLLNEKQVSLSTVDSVHTLLHPTFQLAVWDEIIRKNPSDGVMAEISRNSGKNRGIRHALTIEQRFQNKAEVNKGISVDIQREEKQYKQRAYRFRMQGVRGVYPVPPLYFCVRNVNGKSKLDNRLEIFLIYIWY